MPGFSKMNRAGLALIKELFIANPNMAFTRLTRIYNEEAGKRGWKQLRSPGTIGYHLTMMRLYVRSSRNTPPDPKKGLEIIELKGKEKRRKIARHFGITNQALSLILRHRRNGRNADEVRRMALELGGIRYVKEIVTQ